MTKILSIRMSMLVVLALGAGVAAGASEIIVLTGGKTLELSKPYVVRGTQAVMTLKDGTVISVVESEIDRAATQAARARAAAKKHADESAVVVSPADAARAQKGAPRARLKVGDDDVSHPYVAQGDDDAKDAGESDARVEVVDWDQTPAGGSLTVKGNLRNSGAGSAEGLSLMVMGKDDKGKTLASTTATVAAGTLDAGAVTTFTATLAMPARAASLRFMPKWTSAAATLRAEKDRAEKASEAGSALAKRSAEAAATTAAPASPEPPPASPAAPTYVPQPGYAPPASSSPTSAPDDNHVPYVPGVHEETPPPPQ